MRSLLPFIVAFATGCNSFLDVDTNEDGKLAQALALWESAGLTDYDFTIVNICYCDVQPAIAQVQVRGGEIVSIVDDVTEELAVYPRGIQTIPELFELIQAAIDAPADLLYASYSSRYGYPTLIQIDPDGRVDADELQIQVGRFRVIRAE